MSVPERKRIALPERGVELSTLDFGGSGPLALISHANGFCAGVYEPFARRLSERFRVIAYDSRGHGESSKPEAPDAYDWEHFVEDAIALAERLRSAHGGAALGYGIGHSFGGTATLAAAARRPELFTRIGLLDPVLIPSAQERAVLFPDRPEGAPHPMAEIARRRRARFASRDEARDSWAGRGPFADWDPRAFDLYLEHGLREDDDGEFELSCPREVEAAVFEAGGGFDVFAEAEKLRAPGLVLRADQGSFPPVLFERLVGIAPSLRLQSLPLGHLLPMIEPERVADRLLAFAAELEPAAD